MKNFAGRPIAIPFAFLLALWCDTLVYAADNDDWPSYNRTLTSDRFVPRLDINGLNVRALRQICTYDTGVHTSFQTGPIVVDGVLYGTTEMDTFAVDASNCKELWRVHEEVKPTMLQVNRGVAFAEGRLVRGLQDGRVVAYDAGDGKKLWEQRIADPAKGESVPAAPIAWNGMVFVGNAGGDFYGVKGRMYGLDASNGAIKWEFFLVPKEQPRNAMPPLRPIESEFEPNPVKTWGNAPDVPITGGATWTSYTLNPDTGLLYVPGGNPAPDFNPGLRPGDDLYTDSVVVIDAKTGSYRGHFSITPADFHDWDVSTAPTVARTHSGRERLFVAPKDGHLYGFDLRSGERLFRTPITTIENVEAPLTENGTRFCPGTQGGSEWNGPAFDPTTNLVYTGTIDWCVTVHAAPDAEVKNAAFGQPWSGSADKEHLFGTLDPVDQWKGWLTATDGDTGRIRWRFKSSSPIVGGVTPTLGDLVFFGNIEGTFYALDAGSGARRFSTVLDGAIGGGIISYVVDRRQRLAVTHGMESPIWPTKKTTAKITVFGL